MSDLEAAERAVDRRISPDDPMRGNPAYYFAHGLAALRCIDWAIETSRAMLPEKIYARRGVERILDLPCGYGRVLRMLRVAFPDAEITACDIERDGVDFCVRTFGAKPLYSARDPAEIRALQAGASGVPASLVPEMLDECERRGFSYRGYAGALDSGVSFASPAWVCRQLETRPGLRLVMYTERGWNQVQDVVSCVRIGPHVLIRELSRRYPELSARELSEVTRYRESRVSRVLANLEAHLEDR